MSTQTILIIDDDPLVADMFGEALKLNWFKGDVFIDSSEALSAFNSNSDKYQTVICDMRTPGKSGIEVAVEIKKLNPSVRLYLWRMTKRITIMLTHLLISRIILLPSLKMWMEY